MEVDVPLGRPTHEDRGSELEAAALREAIARVLDRATVELLRLTSSRLALALADYEERHGLPVYSHEPGVVPRAQLLICAAPDCGRRFWTCTMGARRRYCSAACRNRIRYRRLHGLAA